MRKMLFAKVITVFACGVGITFQEAQPQEAQADSIDQGTIATGADAPPMTTPTPGSVAPNPIYDAGGRALVPIKDASGQPIILDQEAINHRDSSGNQTFDFQTLVEIGRHLFTTPYSRFVPGKGETAPDIGWNEPKDQVISKRGQRGDSFGEGEMGPRQRWLALARGDHGEALAPFFNFPKGNRQLRLNGLDSQSCFECHNTIGSTSLSDTGSTALARKPGVTGGPAGFASTAFINPALQCNPGEPVTNRDKLLRTLEQSAFARQGCYLPEFLFFDLYPSYAGALTATNELVLAGPVNTLAKKWRSAAFMFLRNPPHVFGTGYAQKIAEEMTLELYRQRLTAVRQAMTAAKSRLEGVEKTTTLRAKGVSFGTYSVKLISLTPPPARPAFETSTPQPNVNDFIAFSPVGDLAVPGFDVIETCLANGRQTTGTSCVLDGVSRDLIVRPFQWKGIASDERNFVRDALNFHFGMQAVEIHDKKDEDADRDALEVSVAEVSALTAFTMSIRPPVSRPFDAANEPERAASAERGKCLFEGRTSADCATVTAVSTSAMGEAASCASCHQPTMTITDSRVTVRDPRAGRERIAGASTSLSAQLSYESSAVPPQVQSALSTPMGADNGEDTPEEEFMRQLDAFLPGTSFQAIGYTFDLNTGTLPITLCRLSPEEPMGNEACPQPSSPGTSLDVPIFSDFKRHRMGDNLADPVAQPVDRVIFEVQPVPADEFLTRPLWGVADTGPWLHDGRAQSLREAILLHGGRGSEAQPAVDRFTGLPKDDQDAIVDFLLTLRLPVEPTFGRTLKP